MVLLLKLLLLLISIIAFQRVEGYQPRPVRVSFLLRATASSTELENYRGVCSGGREVRLLRERTGGNALRYFEYDVVKEFDEEDGMCLLESGEKVQPSLLSDLADNVRMFERHSRAKVNTALSNIKMALTSSDAVVAENNQEKILLSTKPKQESLNPLQKLLASRWTKIAPSKQVSDPAARDRDPVQLNPFQKFALNLMQHGDFELVLNLMWALLFTRLTFVILMDVMHHWSGHN